MKKLLALIVVALVAAMSCMTVFAAGLNSSEQSVLSNMRTPANMKGNSIYVPASYINQAEARFNTMDMTEAQASKINGIINSGRSYLEGTGKSKLGELTSEEKNTLIGYARQAAAVLDLKVPVGIDPENIKVLDSDGNVIIDESGNVIKTTGAEYDAAPAVVLAVMLALTVVCSAGVAARGKLLKNEEE